MQFLKAKENYDMKCDAKVFVWSALLMELGRNIIVC